MRRSSQLAEKLSIAQFVSLQILLIEDLSILHRSSILERVTIGPVHCARLTLTQNFVSHARSLIGNAPLTLETFFHNLKHTEGFLARSYLTP